MNVRYFFGNHRYILGNKYRRNKSVNKTDNNPTKEVIGGICIFFKQKLRDRRVSPQRKKHEDIEENAAYNNDDYPIILLNNSGQFVFFLQK